MRHPYFLTFIAATALAAGCATRQIEQLRQDLEDSRAADARAGLLSGQLDPESAARLATLGRSSAPTRYTERTDANRIRVVAFDFGGAELGQYADPAGNLVSGTCVPAENIGDFVRYGPWEAPEASDTPAAAGEDLLQLYKGMFRQYGRQVGTTIKLQGEAGPVEGEFQSYISHNFLVLEWRRYRLVRLDQAADCIASHVSAIENGVAVRIVFDVRLKTTDAKLSAEFGIADLAAALSRNEASVEVSYELVGTALDLLPREAIVISSLGEYLEAMKRFHAAVVTIRDAWRDYAKRADENAPIVVETDRETGSPTKVEYDRQRIFTPDDLAYYVDGANVGDTALHLRNVETCEDLETLRSHYATRTQELRAELYGDESTAESDSRRKDRDRGLIGKLERLERSRARAVRPSWRAEIRRDLRALRERKAEAERELRAVARRHDVLEISFLTNDCQRTLRYETQRKVQACALAKISQDNNAPLSSYLGLTICEDEDLEKKAVDNAVRKIQQQQQQRQQ